MKQGGLYHFEGNIYLDANRTSAAHPILYTFLIHVKDRTYTVAHGHTQRKSTGEDIGSTGFSIDIPVESNGTVRLLKVVNNSTTGTVLIRFNGYLIRKI